MASKTFLFALTMLCWLVIACSSLKVSYFSYIGCFVDYTDAKRDMPVMSEFSNFHGNPIESGGVRMSNMSIEQCSKICSQYGFPYFGLQLESYCFCGTSYGSQGAASETECNSVCSGNSSQKCGGLSRNSVFSQTYSYGNLFNTSPWSSSLMSTHQSVSSSLSARFIINCAIACNEGCQAFVFSKNEQVCRLLKTFIVLLT